MNVWLYWLFFLEKRKKNDVLLRSLLPGCSQYLNLDPQLEGRRSDLLHKVRSQELGLSFIPPQGSGATRLPTRVGESWRGFWRWPGCSPSLPWTSGTPPTRGTLTPMQQLGLAPASSLTLEAVSLAYCSASSSWRTSRWRSGRRQWRLSALRFSSSFLVSPLASTSPGREERPISFLPTINVRIPQESVWDEMKRFSLAYFAKNAIPLIKS